MGERSTAGDGYNVAYLRTHAGQATQHDPDAERRHYVNSTIDDAHHPSGFFGGTDTDRNCHRNKWDYPYDQTGYAVGVYKYIGTQGDRYAIYLFPWVNHFFSHLL